MRIRADVRYHHPAPVRPCGSLPPGGGPRPLLGSNDMIRSTRGAARISAIWMIVAIVLFLVAISFAFIAQNDLTAAREQAAAAEASRQESIEQMNEVRNQLRGTSTVLGWYDRESAFPVSDPETAKTALEDLKTTFSDLGEADADLETALPKVVAAYNAKVREVAEMRTRVQTLEGELQAAKEATNAVAAEKDETIAQLRQQISDETQNAQQAQQELQTRLAAAQTQVSDRDLELRQALADAQQLRKDYERRLLASEARINELAKVTSFSREPFNQYPDGNVIEVSDTLGLGWIDIGANQRLTRGMSFRIESGTPGDRRFKAMAEVVSVDANRAEVRFRDVADVYDPVVPGDVIINPLYDPKGGRNAVLVGRFSGAYNESELRLLLARMGINVQDELDRTTHFLIVGSELWTDPETNEPLEEPLQPSELPIFKNAEAQGVQIIPLQDIREFFRVEAGTPSGA